MTWHFGLVQEERGLYTLAEIFVDEDGRLIGYYPLYDFTSEESANDIIEMMRMVLQDIEQIPVRQHADFDTEVARDWAEAGELSNWDRSDWEAAKSERREAREEESE